MTPAGIEPATFRFVAQHLNHCATAVPHRSCTSSYQYYLCQKDNRAMCGYLRLSGNMGLKGTFTLLFSLQSTCSWSHAGAQHQDEPADIRYGMTVTGSLKRLLSTRPEPSDLSYDTRHTQYACCHDKTAASGVWQCSRLGAYEHEKCGCS